MTNWREVNTQVANNFFDLVKKAIFFHENVAHKTMAEKNREHNHDMRLTSELCGERWLCSDKLTEKQIPWTDQTDIAY